MKPTLSTILILCVLIPRTSLAADPQFRFRKEVDRKAAPAEELLAAVLDRDVYAATRDGYADLRIHDEGGTEVPYLLEQASQRQTERVREGCPSEVVSLREVNGKYLEIIVRLRDKSPAAGGLTVVTPLTNFEHRLKVFGSRDDHDWSPLVADGLIFDYTRYMDVRNSDVSLPANDYRRFKLEIEQVLDQRESPFLELAARSQDGRKEPRIEVSQIERRPFRIDRIDLWRTVERESALRPRQTGYAVEALQIEQEAREKVTRINVWSRRQPLTGFTLETPSRNFSRAVRVLVPITEGARTDWREAGRGTVHRFQLRGFHKEELQVHFAETRSEEYQIVIENADNPPLEITSVQAEGNVYRLVFLAAEGRRYRLDYGSDTAESPRYDTAAVLASLGPGYQPIEVGMGNQVTNPGHRDGTGLGKLLNSSILLLLALALMVVVLCWVLLRAGKEIKKLPADEL